MEQNTTETPVQAHKSRLTLEDILTIYKKPVSYTLGAVLLIIVGYIGFQSFYLQPQEEEAQKQIIGAQRYFDLDSLKIALNGDKTTSGFLKIADDYGMTKTGKLAHYYAGVILLQQGKYQDAIDHLKSFNLDSKILAPMALGAIGDAYSQLKQYDDAASYYMKAAKKQDNKFTAPRFYKKAGIVYEELKQYKDAIAAYQVIKDKYTGSFEFNRIDAYIQRAQAKMDSEK